MAALRASGLLITEILVLSLVPSVAIVVDTFGLISASIVVTYSAFKLPLRGKWLCRVADEFGSIDFYLKRII